MSASPPRNWFLAPVVEVTRAERIPSTSPQHPRSMIPRGESVFDFRPRHEDFAGSNGAAARFRAPRLRIANLPWELACFLVCEEVCSEPLPVIDLSFGGFAVTAAPALALVRGSVLRRVEFRLGELVLWTGEAIVVHCNAERIGCRFTSGRFDFHQLRAGAALRGQLALRTEQRERLPAGWRAAVADVHQMMVDVRRELEEFDRTETRDALERELEEAELFARLRSQWGSAYFERTTELHEMSKGFDSRAAALGRSYASSMIMPLWMASPFHRRAFEKPLGYAGDYRMIELCFAERLAGDVAYGRFLDSINKNCRMGRAVVMRETLLRQAIRATVDRDADEPVRLLSVASGPAIELQRFLCETGPLRRPIEFVLLDQDQAAHQSALEQLTRILLNRGQDKPPVTISCLHFSVRQLLKPSTPEEERIVGETLSGLDLIYSAGLYDYLQDPVAAALTRLLSTRLRPGGRLLVGNMVETPEITWLMDYVFLWPLTYRSDEMLRRLAIGVESALSRVEVVSDATGRCLFLDITSPS